MSETVKAQAGAWRSRSPLRARPPLDAFAHELSAPPVAIGDVIGDFQSGAYARSASPLDLLSDPTPAEVLLEDGRTRLIRRRGAFADMVHDIPKPGGDPTEPR